MARRGLNLGYIPKKSPIHRLSGAAKLIMVVMISLACMITYDTRFLLAVIIGSCVMFAISRVPLRDLKVILTLIGIFMILNNVFIFLFSPEEGVAIYGTRHLIVDLVGRYTITQEQLFYQLNVTMKYFSIMPLALIFFVTTEPSEFASSLNKVGVNYKASYSVSLALRYIPTLQREFIEISQAQQARGADMSKNVKLHHRLKGAISIVFPLIVTSIDKIDIIAYAMELRSFGKSKYRTWYKYRPFTKADYAVVIVSASLILVAVLLGISNGGRFYNPFLTG